MSTAAAKWIGGGWTLFIAENVILSENRNHIIGALGSESSYTYVYSAASTVACSSIAYGYWKGRRSGALISGIPRGGRQLAAIGIQGLGFIAAAQLLPKLQIPVEFGPKVVEMPKPASDHLKTETLNPVEAKSSFQLRCPMDFTPTDMPEDGIYGINRVTRHPQLWILGFIGAGAAVATPFLSEAVMFTMPAVLALIGSLHQDSRYRRGMGGSLPPEIDEKTSAIPFVALICGYQPWSKLVEEMKLTNTAAAIFVTMLVATRRRWALRRAIQANKLDPSKMLK